MLKNLRNSLYAYFSQIVSFFHFPTKILYAIPICPVGVTWPAHIVLLDLIFRWRVHIIKLPITRPLLPLLGPTVLLSTVLILSLRSSFTGEAIPNLYKLVDKIITFSEWHPFIHFTGNYWIIRKLSNRTAIYCTQCLVWDMLHVEAQKNHHQALPKDCKERR